MSKGLNKACLIGNVGQDPEVKTLPGGSRVAKLSLATNRSYKDQAGTQREEVEWHRLTCWGKLVDVVEQWVKKGDRLYVEGRLHYSQTDNEGVTRYWTEIVVNELVMLGSAGAERPAAVSAPVSMTEPDDDLPF